MFSRFNVMKYKEALNLLFSPSVINILGERKNLLVLIFLKRKIQCFLGLMF